MSEPFIGEIRMMSYAVIPKGWAPCNGQRLPINQNQALFSLLGTTFGGDGQKDFALPDLRGRVPVHTNANYVQGSIGGEPVHILRDVETPGHGHTVYGNDAHTDTPNPADNFLGFAQNNLFGTGPTAPLSPASVGPGGKGEGHENRQPYLVVNYCIALVGIFPSPN
jgi:microcystin-dependent protein